MNSAICTLFENQYHYGVAALTNSLYNRGFRGDIFAGYKGILPPWALNAKPNPLVEWENCKSLAIAKDLNIHFLPIDTEYHLTNYKPNFMLKLWSGPAKNAEAMVYFDPDIVVKCKWTFYENWMSHGVALVHEITSNDMPQTHPIRLEWAKVVSNCNLSITREITSYINGGFCGLTKQNIDFLFTWEKIIQAAILHHGLEPKKFMPSDRTHIFYASDQDALNIAAMCSSSQISEVGPEGMDFIHGGWIMSHAVGSPKPWKKNYLLSAAKGNAPTLADQRYWTNVDGPILCFKPKHIRMKRLSMRLASLVGRFYRKY